jgi:hypothetical protein
MTANLGEPLPPLLRVVGDGERALDHDLSPNVDHLPDVVYADYLRSLAVIEDMSEYDALRLQLDVVREDRERLSRELDRARVELELLLDAAREIRCLLPERTRDFWEASRILRDIGGVLDRAQRPLTW